MPFPYLRLSALALICGVLSSPNSGRAQSNIVFNGGFEQTNAGWNFTVGLDMMTYASPPEGELSGAVRGTLWQDLQTVPGRDYVISYARNIVFGQPRIAWGGTSPGVFTNLFRDSSWQYSYCYAHADSEVTRLNFTGPGNIDDIKVGWLQEPMRITAQPQGRSGFEGATASFIVAVDGAPPFQYQWRFGGTPIVGATNKSLLLSQLRTTQVGLYSVAISNVAGSIVSENAPLQIIPPATSPEIVAQPVGDICPQGYGCSLSVFAVGAAPLSYQWLAGGTNIPNATNAILKFESIQPTEAGTYTATVSNYLGMVQSLPANLSVTNTTGGGRITFDTFTNNTPIFDVDGLTRLEGSNYAAQIYAGPTADILRPVGALYYFPIGTRAGYISIISRNVPDVATGKTAYVQVRAWETAAGATYEQARWAGGKFGNSSIIATPAGANRVPMKSFSLRAGEPLFTAGRLSVGEVLADGTHEMVLTGEPNARYLIEKRVVPNTWVPFLTLTNISGTAVFGDASQSQETVQFYRARILD